MKKMPYSKYKSKIGYCDNKDLPTMRDLKGGHYVYIRKVYKNGTCDVNIVTSLEDKDKTINHRRIQNVRRGNTYPIPLYDSNFTRWSGINKKPVKNVKMSNIKDVGKKRIKKRHNFFIGKFLQ